MQKNTFTLIKPKFATFLFFVSLVVPWSSSLLAQDALKDVKVQADTYDFDLNSGWAEGEGDVMLNYKGMSVEADSFRYNTQSKEVEAHGDVVLSNPAEKRDESFTWFSDDVSGNIETGAYDSGAHRMLFGNLFERGRAAERKADGVLVFDAARLSTCEHLVGEHGDHSHYHIWARKITYDPETGKFKATHAVFKIGRIPVFYWPVIYFDRDWKPDDLEITIGQDSDWGFFVLIGRNWRLSDNLNTHWNFDYRSKRGFALGNTTTYTTENTETEFDGYVLPGDDNPPSTTADYNRRFDIEEDRYRLKFYHLNRLTDDWTFRLKLDALSDIDMLEEWYEDEFDVNPQPYSYADLRYDHEKFTFSVAAKPRINDFHTVVERLPEIKIDLPRQPLGDSGFYYQGETSLSYLNMKWRDFDRDRAPGLTDGPEDYDSWRLDSLNMFYRPFHLGEVQVTPRAGVRGTWYSESSDNDMTTNDLVNLYDVDDPDTEQIATAISNYDDKGGDIFRVTGEAGVHVARKYRSVWEEGSLPFMNNDGLRLITQPYANYTYIADPSEDRENIYFFDRIDRITEQNFVRVGVENRLQTRTAQRSGIYTLARMNTYADFHFDPVDSKNFGTFANDLRFTPSPKLQFNNLIMLDLDSGNLNYVKTGVTIGEVGGPRLTVSYLYRNDYMSNELNSMGSTLVDYTGENMSSMMFSENDIISAHFSTPLTEKMSASVKCAYDFEESEMAYTVYQLTRDLHCWMGALRYTTEESGDDQTQEIMVMLWLKAFPGFGMGVGQ